MNKFIEFRNSLKPGDILYYDNSDSYYKFMGFTQCNYHLIHTHKKYCKECKGFIKIKLMEKNHEIEICGKNIFFIKKDFEEFIKEEEFSV